MYNVIIMLVVAIAFSITMGGPWSVIKDAANVTESRQIAPFLVYVASIWALALVVFPGVFALVARLANRMAANRVSNRTMTLRLAYILVPIGIFAWIAFSLPMLMVNYSYILTCCLIRWGWGGIFSVLPIIRTSRFSRSGFL